MKMNAFDWVEIFVFQWWVKASPSNIILWSTDICTTHVSILIIVSSSSTAEMRLHIYLHDIFMSENAFGVSGDQDRINQMAISFFPSRFETFSFKYRSIAIMEILGCGRGNCGANQRVSISLNQFTLWWYRTHVSVEFEHLTIQSSLMHSRILCEEI